MNTYPMTHEDKDKEWKTIQEMLKKTISITQKIIHPKQRHKPLINNS
jgi:hypothetical protein